MGYVPVQEDSTSQKRQFSQSLPLNNTISILKITSLFPRSQAKGFNSSFGRKTKARIANLSKEEQ